MRWSKSSLLLSLTVPDDILRDFNPASHKSNLFLIHISKAYSFTKETTSSALSNSPLNKSYVLQLWINKMQNLPKLIPAHDLYSYFFLKRSHNSHTYYWWYCRCKKYGMFYDIFFQILWLLQKRLTFRNIPLGLLLYALPQT